jgi:hypothetical protein
MDRGGIGSADGSRPGHRPHWIRPRHQRIRSVVCVMSATRRETARRSRARVESNVVPPAVVPRRRRCHHDRLCQRDPHGSPGSTVQRPAPGRSGSLQSADRRLRIFASPGTWGTPNTAGNDGRGCQLAALGHRGEDSGSCHPYYGPLTPNASRNHGAWPGMRPGCATSTACGERQSLDNQDRLPDNGCAPRRATGPGCRNSVEPSREYPWSASFS